MLLLTFRLASQSVHQVRLARAVETSNGHHDTRLVQLLQLCHSLLIHLQVAWSTGLYEAHRVLKYCQSFGVGELKLKQKLSNTDILGLY